MAKPPIQNFFHPQEILLNYMELVTGIALAAVKIAEMSKGMGLNRDQYPALNTEETDPEKFWNSLNHGKSWISCGKNYYDNKHQVGAVALNNGLMTANFKWDRWDTKFNDLSKRQQKIIKLVLYYKDEKYLVIGIRAMAGSLFRV